MMFTNKFQTICSVKGGNYKGFARADMYDHFGGSDVSTRATSLFSGFDGGAPPQGQYLYQRNGMATLNGILRTDSFTTMKVNADYSYHRATHDISQSTTYLAEGGKYVTVSEQTSPITKIHLPKLSVNYLKPNPCKISRNIYKNHDSKWNGNNAHKTHSVNHASPSFSKNPYNFACKHHTD